MIDPEMSAKELNSLYLYAWQKGVKTLYYQHSINMAQEFRRREILEKTNESLLIKENF